MHIIRTLIYFYILLIIVDTIISYLPQFKHMTWATKLRKFANYSLDPVRKLLPGDLPFDVSPMIVILMLNLLIALW